MWNWIARNKEWLFSGAAVSALAVVWWVVKKIVNPKHEAPPSVASNSITQSPMITIAPTFNVSQGSRQEEKTPPIPSTRTTPSPEVSLQQRTAKPKLEPNLVCVSTPTMHLCQENSFVFLDAKDSAWEGTGDVAVVAIIANRPSFGSPGVAPVHGVKAQIICRDGEQEIYSGFGAWVGHFSNEADFPPAQTQKLIIATTSTRQPGPVFGMTNPRSYSLPSRPWSATKQVFENSPPNDMPVLKHDVHDIEVTLLDGGRVLRTFIFKYERNEDGTFKLSQKTSTPSNSI